MASLIDIKKSVSEMSSDELRELIISNRASRRVSKKPVVERVAKAEKRKKVEKTTANQMSSLTPAQAAKLLELLGGL